MLGHEPLSGYGGAADPVQVVPFVVGETQRAGERAQQLRRRVPRPALFESYEVLDADAGEQREFLAAQAGRAPSRAGG